MRIKSLVFLLPFFLQACVGLKYLDKGEHILYDQKIKTSGSISNEVLESQLTQTPNSRLLLPISPSIYTYKIGEKFFDSTKIEQKKDKITSKYDRKIKRTKSERKKNKFNTKKLQKQDHLDKKLREGNLIMRWGEPLVILDSSEIRGSIENMNNFLFAKGYFNSSIEYQVHVEDRIASVQYLVEENDPYIIDSLIYNISDPKLAEIFNNTESKLKLKGKKYDQNTLTQERERVYELMSNQGYYNFKRQYVLFEVDSTQLGEHKLIVRETIANPPGKISHKQFRLDSIIFANEASSAKARFSRRYRNVTYSFNNNKYSERLLSYRIFLTEDSLYSKELTLETQKQLSYLDIFKFVNINYDTTGGKFIANIFTSPLKKFQTSTEVGLSTLIETTSLPGPFFNFNAKSRNTFGGLELIQLDANASIQGVKSVSGQQNIYSRIQYGGALSVTFPQFLFPLGQKDRARIGQYNPRTKIATGINLEDRLNEYRRTIFNASSAYIWQVKNNSQYTLKPFDASYIYSTNFGDSFKQSLKELEEAGYLSLVYAFRSSFVSFSALNYRYNKNNYGIANTNSTLILGNIEAGGHSQEIIKNPASMFIPKSDTSFNLAYYQYIKFNFDFRKTNRLTSKSQLAYRFNAGAAYSYGDNHALPYEKYFFAGGSNSIRAWQPRRLGPGSYASFKNGSTSDNIVVNNDKERQGDIIFESSIEFRRDLFGFVDYALFVDAGNIWLWKSQTIDKNFDESPDGTNTTGDDGKFRLRTFPREIAVGSGFGLRFDFSFLILRVDMAYKIIDPAYPLGKRLILNEYKVRDLFSLGYKSTLNIGIGYPF